MPQIARAKAPHLDTSFLGVILAPMVARRKRTYNLNGATIVQVRELAARYGAATSQDAVVELAVERLYREYADRSEREAWSQAAEDPEFRAEMQGIASAYGDRDSWPA
jgi:hypothetical protein